MSDRTTSLPPLSEIARTLRSVTEQLAAELVEPSATPPPWSEIEICMARVVASIHGVSSLLASTLRWSEPQELLQFLRQQSVETARRHENVMKLVADIDERSRALSLAVVGLKGTALYRMGLYSAGQRPMADVDLLVEESDREIATRMLNELGYALRRVTYKHSIFGPSNRSARSALGEDADNPVLVELHTKIVEQLPYRLVDITRAVMPAHSRIGLNQYPTAASLMTHLLLHAAGAMRARAVRLVQLHDIALVAERMKASDWAKVVYARGDFNSWWAFPPLNLVARYFQGSIPSEVLAASAKQCPPLLRSLSARATLTDVSFSDLWIKAMPGWEWSRSITELAVYAFRRFYPTKYAVEEARLLADSHPENPHMSWYKLKQRNRLLRWLVFGSARPQTLAPFEVAWLDRAGHCSTRVNS